MSILLSLVLVGVVARSADEKPGAPQAIRLSQVLEQMSQDTAFRERLLQSLNELPNAWGLIGQNQIAQLRHYILDRNWEAVDHFPGMTVWQLNASVAVAKKAATKIKALDTKLKPPFVETGPFRADVSGEADWDGLESEEAAATPEISTVGFGLTMGDAPNPELWKWHTQSLRAAEMFNRLALNRLEPKDRLFRVKVSGRQVESPEELVRALAKSGDDIWVEDARFFANFGHFHFRGQDVLMPFWINTQIEIPNSKQQLLVPVSHAEEEIHIRGASRNADVSFYFGIDGRAEFRTMDTLDQPWVGRNAAHTYRGGQAVEGTRLLAEALSEYAEAHRNHPELSFNGYYTLGVCQDVVAAVEYRLTGKATLFPITNDRAYFTGDGEIAKLFERIPNDRGRARPEWARVMGSLPVKSFGEISLPELRRNLERVQGSQGTATNGRFWGWLGLGAILAILLSIAAWLELRK